MSLNALLMEYKPLFVVALEALALECSHGAHGARRLAAPLRSSVACGPPLDLSAQLASDLYLPFLASLGRRSGQPQYPSALFMACMIAFSRERFASAS